MRIVAGRAGGIPIVCPKSVTRPTSERVREALFSILGTTIDGARVLDLFSGSGALGLEALSRGASSAVFVEQSAAACRCIEANIAKTKLEGAVVRRCAVASWLNRQSATAAANDPCFDLVFADPPYCKGAGDTDFAADLVRSEALAGSLSQAGLFILETEANRQLSESEVFVVVDARSYGSSAVHFYSRSAP